MSALTFATVVVGAAGVVMYVGIDGCFFGFSVGGMRIEQWK